MSEELDPEGVSEELSFGGGLQDSYIADDGSAVNVYGQDGMTYGSSDDYGVTDAQIGVNNIAGDPMLTNTTTTGANDAARGYVGNVTDATVSSTIDDDILATGVAPGSFNIANMPTGTGNNNIVSTQQVNDNVVDNQDISGDSSGVGFSVGSAIDNAVNLPWPDDGQDGTPMVYMPNHPQAVNGYIPEWLANQGI